MGILVVPELPSQPWYPLFKAALISDTVQIVAKVNVFVFNRKEEVFWQKITLVAGILSGGRLS